MHFLRLDSDEDDIPALAQPDTIFGKYFRFLFRFRFCLVVSWMIILITSLFLAHNMEEYTGSDADPKEGSLAAVAQDFYDDNYDNTDIESDSLVIECDEPGCVFSEEIRQLVNVTIYKAFLDFKKGHDKLKQYSNYWSLQALGLQGVAYSLVNNRQNSTAMLVQVQRVGFDPDVRSDYVDLFRDTAHGNNPDPNTYRLGWSGMEFSTYDAHKETAKQSLKVDVICMPLAMLLLLYFIQSWRFLIIPGVNIAITLMFSKTLMWLIAMVWEDLPDFVSSVMEVFAIAMNIDYSLFFLTRYRKEREAKHSHMEAICISLRHAGHVIGMSGMTLFFCSLGLILFRVSYVKFTGVALGTTLAVALVTNLTLTPAWLLAFPNFFIFQLLPFMEVASFNEAEEEDDIMELESDEQHPPENGSWYNLTKRITTYPCNWIIMFVLFAISIPIGVQVVHMDHSVSLDQISPKDCKSSEALDLLSKSFSPGLKSPFKIIVDSGGSVLTEKYLDTLNDITQKLIDDAGLPEGSVTSLWLPDCASDGHAVPQCYELARQNPNYAFLWDAMISTDGRSSMITALTPFDPTGEKATPFVDKVYDILGSDLPQEFDYYFTSFFVNMKALADEIFDVFPINVIITLVIVFVVVSLGFKSVFLPIRYLLTLVIPISFIFGLAVLVYQNNILGWLGWRNLSEDIGPMYWFSPVITFFVAIGLALDYDIFLYLRIMEFREQGYDTDISTFKAVQETGGIITAAGIIMAVVFFGLILSATPTLIQMGFLFTFSVLFDTFVTRTIMVPIVVTLLGDWNWYPVKFETTTSLNSHDVSRSVISSTFQNHGDVEYAAISKDDI